MQNVQEANSLFEKVQSIQDKFMQSLITGKRDPMFGETEKSSTADFEEHPGGNSQKLPR